MLFTFSRSCHVIRSNLSWFSETLPRLKILEVAKRKFNKMQRATCSDTRGYYITGMTRTHQCPGEGLGGPHILSVHLAYSPTLAMSLLFHASDHKHWIHIWHISRSNDAANRIGPQTICLCPFTHPCRRARAHCALLGPSPQSSTAGSASNARGEERPVMCSCLPSAPHSHPLNTHTTAVRARTACLSDSIGSCRHIIRSSSKTDIK